MLFNCYEFIFIFLCIVLLRCFILSRFKSSVLSVGWLVTASFFFYGCWNPKYLFLIIGCVIFNYFIGNVINKEVKNKILSSRLFFIKIVANLACIGYFKYYFCLDDTGIS
ncbi:MBOAT family O-acyltransferase [Crocosphaera chwakensis]|uniref:Alginate O-acetyltransferase n=1 Tax=Crocosphaera chwakensis CCY0110 TaxID=391612 RepID=A3IVF6_9CHRO|nr:alginate O-acetyltransferase [Crocosphaera chwakensis]EAZ89528.1 alginate O-acetyltransferase [Crocosphaera chwakensis CCY0110]